MGLDQIQMGRNKFFTFFIVAVVVVIEEEEDINAGDLLPSCFPPHLYHPLFSLVLFFYICRNLSRIHLLNAIQELQRLPKKRPIPPHLPINQHDHNLPCKLPSFQPHHPHLERDLPRLLPVDP